MVLLVSDPVNTLLRQAVRQNACQSSTSQPLSGQPPSSQYQSVINQSVISHSRIPGVYTDCPAPSQSPTQRPSPSPPSHQHPTSPPSHQHPTGPHLTSIASHLSHRPVSHQHSYDPRSERRNDVDIGSRSRYILVGDGQAERAQKAREHLWTELGPVDLSRVLVGQPREQRAQRLTGGGGGC